jgi:O-methyltransferase
MPFDATGAYLDLLKRSLAHRLEPPSGEAPFSAAELTRARSTLKRVRSHFQGRAAEGTAQALLQDFGVVDVARFLRINSPQGQTTLLGDEALDHLRACANQVILLEIPGDFMECGVWRGGACIWMRALQLALGAPRRRVWVADSFQGLPQPDPDRHLLDAIVHEFLRETGSFGVSIDEVRDNFRRYNLLDEGVRFLPGWFHETLPGFDGQLALLRLDGDYYESTLTALDCLYDKVSLGGYIVIDDYHPVVGAYAAVNEFRQRRHIQDPLTRVTHQLHFWRKL